MKPLNSWCVFVCFLEKFPRNIFIALMLFCVCNGLLVADCCLCFLVRSQVLEAGIFYLKVFGGFSIL